MNPSFKGLLAGIGLCGGLYVHATELTIATFNVSMEAENYVAKGSPLGPEVLAGQLASGKNPQISNIAAILQQVRPDILLLNEFDYIADPAQGVQQFISQYLTKPQHGGKPLQYPYFYYQTVNTGQPSGFDLNNDGKVEGAEDAWGFGHYPGQYGMLVLSRYPIDATKARTFQHFKWKDMPGHKETKKADGSAWFSPQAWENMPLSSKSHWDLPLSVDGKPLHLLISHPTPPVFDGPENRNGHRNHDEVKFWVDYLSGNADYIYDDKGGRGGYQSTAPFIVMGDQNSSPDEGDAHRDAIQALVNHPTIQHDPVPQSAGGAAHTPDNPMAKFHTAGWRMRADYVLPSKHGIKVHSSGVCWPVKGEPLYEAVASRGASSDHRLVWIKLSLTDEKK